MVADGTYLTNIGVRTHEHLVERKRRPGDRAQCQALSRSNISSIDHQLEERTTRVQERTRALDLGRLALNRNATCYKRQMIQFDSLSLLYQSRTTSPTIASGVRTVCKYLLDFSR